jgi:predicted small lipoprotein YifL
MKKLNWIVLVCAGVAAAGCGQKGPLFLPDKNASVVTRPAGSATPPAQPEDKKKDDDQSAAPKN